MERKNEKKYTTGEFADYFGIKKDTLFYYDKIKLFCPAGVESNGYRYYTSSQINTLWTLLSLRDIGVPVKVLQDYFKAPSPERLDEIAKIQIQKIDAEMSNLRRIKRLLTDISSSTMEAMRAAIGKVHIQTLPDQQFIYSSENDRKTDTSNQQWESIYENFVHENSLTGSAYVGSVISQEDLRKGQFRYICRLFTASPGRNGTIRQGGQYAVFYHKGNYDSIPEIYPDILKEIEHLGFMIAGDAYEEYLVAEIATDCENDYVTKIEIKISPQ